MSHNYFFHAKKYWAEKYSQLVRFIENWLRGILFYMRMGYVFSSCKVILSVRRSSMRRVASLREREWVANSSVPSPLKMHVENRASFSAGTRSLYLRHC